MDMAYLYPQVFCMDQHPESHDPCHPIPSDNTPHTTPHLFQTPVMPRQHSLERGGDTPLCSDAPKLFSVLSKSILILTPLLYYKCPWMDCSQPSQKPNRSNSELDPSKPFLLVICLSLYFMFSSCSIFKLSATYVYSTTPP